MFKKKVEPILFDVNHEKTKPLEIIQTNEDTFWVFYLIILLYPLLIISHNQNHKLRSTSLHSSLLF